jgi:hypothetical protein
MSLEGRIAEDMKQAMKQGDRERTAVLRMVRSRIQEATVKARGERGRDAALSEEEVVQVIASYAKQRRDSIEGYRQGGREDLAKKEEAELGVLQDYLPEQLTEAELREIVADAVREAGASSAADMGKVMGKVMPRVKGKADGKLVNRLVREMLAS